MRKSQSVFLALYLVILFLLNSCATTGNNKVTLSPKQQSVIWLTLYNEQYKAANTAVFGAVLSNASNEYKEYLMKKLKILSELKPLLEEYNTIAWADGTPSDKLIYSINYLIYRLTEEIVSGGTT